MAAEILDGNAVAKEIRADLRVEIDKRRHPAVGHSIKPPCLAVVLCSDDPASQVYVRKKQEACAEVGITSFLVKPFEGGVNNWFNPMGHLLRTIEWLNDDDSVHGILVQLPLPVGFDQKLVFDRINPLKDVDVFSPENVGLLMQGRQRFVPCTPAGVQELLSRHGISLDGKHVTIINRSDIVGKPLHALLSQDGSAANATCTLCHDHTLPWMLKEMCLRSQIVIVAVGKPGFLTADMVCDKAVVVDVGINRLENGKLVGDCDYEAVRDKAAWITPVPGGVGPMTVAMLLRNTLQAQKLQGSNLTARRQSC